MAMIVTLKNESDGLYTVEIKREFDSSSETKEFTKEGLNEYLESAKQYCDHKRYEFIYREELTEEESSSRLDDIGQKVFEQELGFQESLAKNAGVKMTYQFYLEDWFDDKGKNIALVVYWNEEAVETYRF